jgi:hypothetical protein
MYTRKQKGLYLVGARVVANANAYFYIVHVKKRTKIKRTVKGHMADNNSKVKIVIGKFTLGTFTRRQWMYGSVGLVVIFAMLGAILGGLTH